MALSLFCDVTGFKRSDFTVHVINDSSIEINICKDLLRQCVDLPEGTLTEHMQCYLKDGVLTIQAPFLGLKRDLEKFVDFPEHNVEFRVSTTVVDGNAEFLIRFIKRIFHYEVIQQE